MKFRETLQEKKHSLEYVTKRGNEVQAVLLKYKNYVAEDTYADYAQK